MKDVESGRFERQPFIKANRGIMGCCTRFIWECGGALPLVEIHGDMNNYLCIISGMRGVH